MPDALAVVERDVPAVAQQGSVTPMQLLNMAVSQGADIDKLSKLMDLQERWERNEARKAFVVALNAFKANPPQISKNKQVSFATSKGRTEYRHATLDQVSGIIGAGLAVVGISHRWDVKQLEGKIHVTCVLTHSLGHSESVSLAASADDSGGKNAIQGVGSTVTYLQRYTLLAASGMAVQDGSDDDGTGTGLHEMDARVKADFLAAIDALADLKSAEALWASIASECTKSGDVPAYDELKASMAAKRKALKQQESRA